MREPSPIVPALVIIGAGLAGLTCAKILAEKGACDFFLLEANAEPGGRVRSAHTADGYTLDRGFQVLLDSYPAVRRHLDLPALAPRYFDSGALLADPDSGRPPRVAAHPLRHPADLPATALTDAFPVSDKARLALLVAELLATPDAALLAETTYPFDISTAGFLFQRGFSPAVVERFLRPFFGGVFLDERLSTSAGLFRYYLKKFATGRALLPAGGIGGVPRQLAARLPAGTLRLNCPVARIETAGPRATAVVTDGGERIACERLLLATDAPATAHLLEGGSPPRRSQEPLGARAVYFSSTTSLYDRPMLVLPAGRRRVARHFVQLTNVVPEYAPAGKHLLSATVLDESDASGGDDDTLFRTVRSEIAEIFPVAARTLEPLAVVRVPYAQRRQPARFTRHLCPAPAPTHWENVFLAGDQTTACSIQSAMSSGEQAAAGLQAQAR